MEILAKLKKTGKIMLAPFFSHFLLIPLGQFYNQLARLFLISLNIVYKSIHFKSPRNYLKGEEEFDLEEVVEEVEELNQSQNFGFA